MSTQATAFLQLPFVYQADLLLADYQRLQSARWLAHYNQQAHQGDWTCLPLRAAAGQIDNIYADNGDAYADTEWLKLCPYFSEILQQLACEKIAVRLMSLAAGARILPHRDPGGGFEDGVARLHIPIVTDPAIEFVIDGMAIHFSAAKCWYMNANCLHEVNNPSAINRVHLVIDCIPNPWLREVFSKAGWRENTPAYYGDPNINEHNIEQVIAALLQRGDSCSNQLAQDLQARKNAR